MQTFIVVLAIVIVIGSLIFSFVAPASNTRRCRFCGRVIYGKENHICQYKENGIKMSDTVVIVALPIGNHVVRYNDGDEVPVHQTMVFLGQTTNITPEEASKIRAFLDIVASETPPMTATVSGKGTLGPDDDRVVFTESEALTSLHEYFVNDPLISKLFRRVRQHPNWISHVTGLQNLKYGDFILYNRLGFWYGEDRSVHHLTQPTTFTVD